jgi:hypothetical protein
MADGKLLCDCCGKKFETLGSYGDRNWWVCDRCFDQADLLAARDDRWPDKRDFSLVRARQLGK